MFLPKGVSIKRSVYLLNQPDNLIYNGNRIYYSMIDIPETAMIPIRIILVRNMVPHGI